MSNLVMNPKFFIGSLVAVFVFAMLGSLFLASIPIMFFSILSFNDRVKMVSKKFEEIGDEEVGW